MAATLSRFRASVALLIVAVIGVAGYLARHEVVGILFNQARYEGHPTSYWKNEVQKYPARRNIKHEPAYGDCSNGLRKGLVQLGLASPALGWLEEPVKPAILETNDREALPVLAELLSDKDPDVRFNAAEGICGMDSTFPSEDPLLRAARNEVEKQFEIICIFNNVLFDPGRARELRPRLQELLAKKKGARDYDSWRQNLINLSERCGVDLLGDGESFEPRGDAHP